MKYFTNTKHILSNETQSHIKGYICWKNKNKNHNLTTFFIKGLCITVTWPWILAKLSLISQVRTPSTNFLKWLWWTQTWATQNSHQGNIFCSALNQEQCSQQEAYSFSFLYSLPQLQSFTPEYTHIPWPGQHTRGDCAKSSIIIKA